MGGEFRNIHIPMPAFRHPHLKWTNILVTGLLEKSLSRVSALCFKKMGGATGQGAVNPGHLSHKWSICIHRSQPPWGRWGGRRTTARGQVGLWLTSSFWLSWQDLHIHDLEASITAYTRPAQDEASQHPAETGLVHPDPLTEELLTEEDLGAGNQLHHNGRPLPNPNRCIWSTNWAQ